MLFLQEDGVDGSFCWRVTVSLLPVFRSEKENSCTRIAHNGTLSESRFALAGRLLPCLLDSAEQKNTAGAHRSRCCCLWLCFSALVAALPDLHFFGIGDQLVAEIRMGDRDERLGALPSGQTLEADLAVLGDDEVRVGAGVRDNRTLGERRTAARTAVW